MLGKRLGYGKEAMPPHSLTMTMIGASLLWVGWFGFNVGTDLEANGIAAMALVNTHLATATAVLAWMFGEWIFKGKPTMLGAASGAVAGLVAITPACGFVGPMGAIVLGISAGLVCLWAVTGLKSMLGYDDALDVFGVHCIGGILGAIGTGILMGGAGRRGLPRRRHAWAGRLEADRRQADHPGVVGRVSFILLKIVDATIGLRVTEEQEREGLDINSHGEGAYNS